jgi:hypothetical protein
MEDTNSVRPTLKKQKIDNKKSKKYSFLFMYIKVARWFVFKPKITIG